VKTKEWRDWLMDLLTFTLRKFRNICRKQMALLSRFFKWDREKDTIRIKMGKFLLVLYGLHKETFCLLGLINFFF